MIMGLMNGCRNEKKKDTCREKKNRLMKRVLEGKEERREFQQELLRTYSLPLITLTLNLPGGYEDYDRHEEVFHSALRALTGAFGETMVEHRHRLGKWGPEGFWVVDLPPEDIKEAAMDIEEVHPLGRIFDIDVMTGKGRILSRRDFSREGRRCLVCGEAALECYRAGTHGLEEVQSRVKEIMSKGLRNYEKH